MIYLHLEGNATERGFQHGFLLFLEIEDYINRISNTIHNTPLFGKINIDKNSTSYEKKSNSWWNFLRNRIFDIYWDRCPEEYQQEIAALAEGARSQGIKIHGRNIDYIDILTLNQYFEFMIRITNFNKGLHPFRFFFNSLKLFFSKKLSDNDKNIGVFSNHSQIHHCSAFIATGDATTNGQIVASQECQIGAWWIPYNIGQRMNVISDIVPSTGYRFQMSCAPGSIWSGQNYYQNEKGIIIVDTTAPQGLWSNKGYSMAIRTRMAVQYSKNIDEAITHLKNKNDGLWSSVYLLGDTKTGEIARFELGLYKSKICRKSDGFFWSANNAEDLFVRFEAYGFGIKDIFSRWKTRFLSFLDLTVGCGYTTIRYVPLERDIKFKELGNKYYGLIDVEVVKNKIMNVEPICNRWAMSLIVSDTNLVDENSLWAYWGNCLEGIWDVSYLANNLKGGKDVPPVGWALINGMPEKHSYKLPDNSNHIPNVNYELNWKRNFAEDSEARNLWHAKLTQSDKKVFAATSNGIIYSLNDSTGEISWKKKINDYDNDTWININNDVLFVGWTNESLAINTNTGEILWKNNQTRYLCSKPVILDEKVFFGSRYGDIFALNLTNGEIIWNTNFTYYDMYLTVDKNNNTLIAACGNKCYSIDSNDGEILWYFEIDGLILSPVKIFENTIYYGSSNTNIYALNKTNGELVWKNNTGWAIQTTPDIKDNTLYIGSMDHNLYAFDVKNGRKTWTFNCKSAIRSSPKADEEHVFFGCDDGRFYAVNRTDGKLVWSFSPGFTINDDIHNYLTTCIVSDCIMINKQVLMSANGEIFSFDLS